MAKIMRAGVLKTACFMGLYSLFVGIVFSILSLIVGIAFSSLFSSYTMPLLSVGGIMLFVLPLIYGFFGFVFGLIFTPISNLVLKIVKGIDLEIELSGHKY